MVFDPAKAVLVAADDVSRLRRCDVFRVLEWTPVRERVEVAAYLCRSRPDLVDEVTAVLIELA